MHKFNDITRTFSTRN